VALKIERAAKTALSWFAASGLVLLGCHLLVAAHAGGLL